MSVERIYVAGHRGMVGSAIIRHLIAQGLANSNIATATHAEEDITNQSSVQQFFNQTKPTQVYLADAKVGGIYANNTYPADFIYENLMIQANVVDAAFKTTLKNYCSWVQAAFTHGVHLNPCVKMRYFKVR